MIRRVTLQTVAIVMLMGAALLPAQQASAMTSEWISGAVLQGQWRYYTTQRKVTYSPWEIAFMKTDGPAIGMLYYGCGDSAGAGSGPEVYIPNPDPTGWYWLRAGKSWGITFCLAAKSYGNNQTDTFTGLLDWDGGY